MPTFSAEKSLYRSSRHYLNLTHAQTSILTGEIYAALTTSVAELGGGTGGTIGTLQAWGCFKGRCCKQTGICGGPNGPGPVRRCCLVYEPCTRCIWPW